LIALLQKNFKTYNTHWLHWSQLSNGVSGFDQLVSNPANFISWRSLRHFLFFRMAIHRYYVAMQSKSKERYEPL